MPKLETIAINETIAVNRELCNYFLHLFNASLPPMIPGNLQISKQALKYQELTTELIAFNIRLEILKKELESLAD
jgi:hypothetical protein